MPKPALLISLFGIMAQSLFAQDTDKKIVLQSVYATSTATPFQKYDVRNVFDNNRETYWKTMPGAGPDEGIMIYFQQPTYINKIIAINAKGPDLANLRSLEVYGDGRNLWNGENIDSELSSLYIRISSLEESKFKRPEGKSGYYRLHFPENLSAAISELELYDADGNIYEVVTPEYHTGSISASSSLEPEIAYGPGNLMDSKKEFGWAEGVKGDGIGQQLEFHSNDDITISSLKFWNGYQRSFKHFSGNARLNEFKFGLKGGELKTYKLSDEQGGQFVDLASPLTGKDFVLEILSSYKGTKYQDLVISEIQFYNKEVPILIRSQEEENRVKETHGNENAILKNYIDRNISVNTSMSSETETATESSWTRASLIIRSNNSFVLYQSSGKSIEKMENDEYDFTEDQNESIADGGWELKEVGDGYVKIRVFGKIFTPTTSAEMYKGEVTSENVRIFQDNLTLTSDKISGQRFVNDIEVE